MRALGAFIFAAGLQTLLLALADVTPTWQGGVIMIAAGLGLVFVVEFIREWRRQEQEDPL